MLANYRKDGTIFYNELYIAPIKNHLGTVTHYIGVQNDITIRNLKEASEQLEIANDKKLQKQKDDFISVASHELRIPVTRLNGTLQLMNQLIAAEPSVNEKLVHLSKNAKRHTSRLIQLIGDLLSSTAVVSSERYLIKRPFPFPMSSKPVAATYH